MTKSRFVVQADDVIPILRAGKTISERTLIGPDFGSTGLTESLLSIGPGTTPLFETGTAHELLFVVSGSGEILAGDGLEHDERIPFGPETGFSLAAGQTYRISVPGPAPVELVSVRVIDPPTPASSSAVNRHWVSRLSNAEVEHATAGRDFRILADRSSGFPSGTHFVGYVPPGEPAPVHFHRYDEVLYILDGEALLLIDGEQNLLRPGTCYQLPAGTLHQVINTGIVPLREVAVFTPAGSPAEAYYPDGSPCLVD